MLTGLFTDKKFMLFVAKFLLVFCILYFGTLAVIGFSSPGHYYIPFVENYLDYVSGIKHSLLYMVKQVAGLWGMDTIIKPGFIIRAVNGRGVVVAMSCVGYGVYSFWIAYVAATSGRSVRKICWIAGGVLLLWFINVMRISLLLLAINKGWPVPLGIDHHTWFNIFAYLAIFIMIWLFEKNQQKLPAAKNENGTFAL